MDDFSSDPFQEGVVKWILGFFGVIAAVKFLPKVLGFITRRFVFGLLSEVIMVILAGLLTEKVVEKIAGDETFDESLSSGR